LASFSSPAGQEIRRVRSADRGSGWLALGKGEPAMIALSVAQPMLDLDDIQGDLLQGLQKNVEAFLFFSIVDAVLCKTIVRQYVTMRIISAQRVQQRESIINRQNQLSEKHRESFSGLNLGLTKNGLDRLLGTLRPQLDPAFERGADHPNTIAALNDPPKSRWLPKFVADRIDGVLLITGPDRSSVTAHSNELLRLLGVSIKIVYAEIGNVRPGAQYKHEHFGFLDGVSQPGIRGLTPSSKPNYRPEEGLPGQDLVWPGEFVFGYPGQDPTDPIKAGPPPDMRARWLKNGSYMVFRRLEQKVPEFRRFVAERAARLGMDRELLAARMVGRWPSGAPLEVTPLRDNPALGGDEQRNNDFGFADDALQRKCPYAAHIRKMYRRDDVAAAAEAQRHRIIRAGIPFGPEVMPGETTTKYSRGLMFVCYQTSIERQFEFIQRRYANNPDFPADKRRPGGGAVVPGFDPIVGQAPGNGARAMDEPFPNYPAGNRRTTLDMPDQFVNLTAAAYFFMPSITALRTVLT
jgi:Dyp-type peroxidase family